jgi:hypothetical protein
VFKSDRKDWKANTHNQRLRKEFLRESVLVKRESHACSFEGKEGKFI